MYLQEIQGGTRGPTDKDPATYDQYGKHPRHETEDLARYGETEIGSSFRYGPKSCRTRLGIFPEEAGDYSKYGPYGDIKTVRHNVRPNQSRAGAHRRRGHFPSDGSSGDSDSDEGRRHLGSRRDCSHRRRWYNSEGYSTNHESHHPGHRPGRGRRITERSAPKKRIYVIKARNYLFIKAVNYNTYRLESRRPRYNSDVAPCISRIRKRLGVQMKSDVQWTRSNSGTGLPCPV